LDDPTVDDETEDFFPGSTWMNTATTPPRLFVCKSNANGAAVWIPNGVDLTYFL